MPATAMRALSVLIVTVTLGLLATAGLPGASEAQAAGPYWLYFPYVQRSAAHYDWPQFGFDAQHSGNNTKETTLSASNVGNLRLLFQKTLPSASDGAPAYLSHVATPQGVRDLVFVTTRAGGIFALDARSGEAVWSNQSYGADGCLINNNAGRNEACYTTSSPAIDPNRQYVYNYGLDGKVHKFAVGTGVETIGAGWPQITTLKRYDEKGSSALAVATARDGTSYLYMAHAGYPGDAGNYQGHITAINLADGSQKVFNTLCSNLPTHLVDSRVSSGPDCYPETMSGVWARPGVIYDFASDRLYLTTGNATFSPGSFHWGDTVLAIRPDGSSDGGRPLDTYTPTNYQQLDDNDTDLGSVEPAILPTAAGKYPHLGVQSGKDSLLRLLNLDDLSGQGGPGHTGGEVAVARLPISGVVFSQPAVWVSPADQSTWVFVGTAGGLAGFQLVVDASGNPSLQARWSNTGAASAARSPIIANGVLYSATNNLVSARSPVTGDLLWSDNQIGSIHWQSPIVANGVLYIPDLAGQLTAYALP